MCTCNNVIISTDVWCLCCVLWTSSWHSSSQRHATQPERGKRREATPTYTWPHPPHACYELVYYHGLCNCRPCCTWASVSVCYLIGRFFPPSGISSPPSIAYQYHKTTFSLLKGKTYYVFYKVWLLIVSNSCYKIWLLIHNYYKVWLLIVIYSCYKLKLLFPAHYRYIANLFTDVPFPTPRRPRVQMQMGPESIVFSLPIRTPLPMGWVIGTCTYRGVSNRYMYI